jgi:hypothetical protein
MRTSALYTVVVEYTLSVIQLWILLYVVVKTQKKWCPPGSLFNSINPRNPLFLLQVAMMAFSTITIMTGAFTSHLTVEYTANSAMFCSAIQHLTILCYVCSSFCVYMFLLYRAKTIKSRFTSNYSKLENSLSFLLVLVILLLGYAMYSLRGEFVVVEDGSLYCTFFLEDFIFIFFGALDAALNIGFLLLFYLPLRSVAAKTASGGGIENEVIQGTIRKNFWVCAVTVALSFVALACSSVTGEVGTYLAPVPCMYLIVTSVSLQWCTSAAWIRVESREAPPMRQTEHQAIEPVQVQIEHRSIQD